MKVKGKIGKLKDVLTKASCGDIFPAVTLKFVHDKNQVISKMNKSQMFMISLRVNGLEIDAEEDKIVKLNASKLIDQLSVIPDGENFEATFNEQQIIIKTNRDQIFYYLSDDWNDESEYQEGVPLIIEDGRIYLDAKSGKKMFNTKATMSSKEWSEIISRFGVSKTDYVAFEEKEGTLNAVIGSLTSRTYTPRIYKTNAKVSEGVGDGDVTKIQMGLPQIGKVIEGNIELHYSNEFPMVIYNYDDDNDFDVMFTIAPRRKED